MLPWSHIIYGAALSAIAAGAVTAAAAGWVPASRRLASAVTALVAAGVAPLAWNAILRATHASQFFTDAPIPVLPASWQDTGSGVFALAATAVLLGVGPLAATPARRTISLSSSSQVLHVTRSGDQ